MKKLFILFFITMLFGLSSKSLQAQITRGADTAEIYIASFWYIDYLSQYHHRVFHSTNNGKDLSPRYEYDYEHAGCIMGDKKPGTLYLENSFLNSLLFSNDTANTFTIVNDTLVNFGLPFAGTTENEVYITSSMMDNKKLYRSVNHGITFNCQNPSLSYAIGLRDVGTEPGELYAIDDISSFKKLFYSNDFGVTFSQIPIDTSISIAGGWHLTRGTLAGEFYLYIHDNDEKYHIYHTFNYGADLELKHVTNPFNYLDNVAITAGRTPGTLYMAQFSPSGDGGHEHIYIHFSRDYGVTYTTYFHDLDSTFTAVPDPVPVSEKSIFTAYPNPFSSELSFTFRLPEETAAGIKVYDMTGREVWSLKPHICPAGEQTIRWDGRNNANQALKPGIYYGTLVINGIPSEVIKVIRVQ